MKQLSRWICGCLLLPALLCGRTPSPFEKRVDRILAKHPAVQQAHWGILIQELESGRTILSRNPAQLFIPASNTKLFTSALALTRLGPNYVFHTRVLAPGPPDASGTVRGDLSLVGGGDPNLSARVLPYREHDGFGPDSLAAIEALADQVVAHGVRHVTGSVTGDDTAWIWEPFPPGWAWDDAVEEYGAAVSALAAADSSFKLTLTAGAVAGEPVALTVDPPVPELVIHNRVQTADGETAIAYERMPLADELTISGSVRTGTQDHEQLAAADPARFAARALRQALIERGVRIDGDTGVRHRLPGEEAAEPSGTQLAARDSVPLAQILQVVNKASQNLHAEMVLREVARASKGTGSRADGLAEMRDFLAGIGIAETAYEFADGSGLSRLNLVSPAAAVQLLRTMYRSPLSETWVALLPVGGVDGTLSDRFADDRRGAWIHAKTGSMRHVSALSGYVLPPAGKKYLFSILVNGYNCPVEEVRDVVDKILLALPNGKH